MTAREYAKIHNHEVVGKLVKTSVTCAEYDEVKCKEITFTLSFYIDEASNEYHSCGNGQWCIITADGAVI